MRLANITQSKSGEPTWHIWLAVLVAIGLQLLLKDELVFSSKYSIASLEVILLFILVIPQILPKVKRLFALCLVSLVSVANLASLGLVVQALLASGKQAGGHQLLVSSVAIYLTNIIIFGILYWELDNSQDNITDFQFPQANAAPSVAKVWAPTFFDYLYVSVTNATAFSPTDTLPLTHRAKLLMTIQSLTSLVTVALVAARAVNILG